jgi:two-component system chemotaxis response regulator CheY
MQPTFQTPHHARILSVGQCDFDGSNIERLLREHFAVQVETARDTGEALPLVCESRFDLVLVNRIFDGNGESGLEFIRRVKAHPQTRPTPVMLVSNFADAQQSAVELGAQPGFGKNALQATATIDRIAAALREPVTMDPAAGAARGFKAARFETP